MRRARRAGRARRHRIGRVARSIALKRRSRGFAGFGSLGRSLETIALKVPPATDVSGGSFDDALARWMGKLQAQIDARAEESRAHVSRTHPGLLDKPTHKHFSERRVVAETGPKYVRVVTRDVKEDGSLGGGTATAFVERTTGNIYKPASFKGPTKNFVRGNIFDLTKPPRMNY
jgi:hypothetical protein